MYDMIIPHISILECMPGYYRPGPDEHCVECPVGTYTDTLEIPFTYLQCTSCGPGETTSPTTGHTSRDDCSKFTCTMHTTTH